MQKIKLIFSNLLKRKRSFTSVVMSNFVLLSFIFFLVIILTFFLFSYMFHKLTDEYYFYDDVYTFTEEIDSEKYDELDTGFLAKSKGWLIVKKDKVKVYSSMSSGFTLQEMEAIMSHGSYDKRVYQIDDNVQIEVIIPEKGFFERIDKKTSDIFNWGQWIFLAFLLLSFVVCNIMVAKLLSKRIKKPINSMKAAMMNYTDRQMTIPEEYSNIKEFNDLFHVLNDMTEALKKSESERKNLETSRTDMLASLSHDIKTPLASIQGYSKAIQDGYVDEDRMKHAFEIIESKSNEVLDMINLMHEYIKLEHADYDLQLKHVDIVEALRVWLAECYYEIDAKGYHMHFDLPEYPVMAYIDVFHLRRVIMNLLYNAVNHNQPGINIHIKFDVDESNYLIWIEDDGKGLPDITEQQLFSPFSKGDDSRTSKGSGLGLAIAWQILRLHKGRLMVEKPNETYNTRFKILLPRKTS